jgi:hypothetical protein
MTELAITDRVVTRWIRHPSTAVVRAFEAAVDRTDLRLDEPFTSAVDPKGRVSAHAHGRIGSAKVEVTVTEWSSDLTEITIRRHGRQLIAWSPRRERRYFDLAHDAAATVVTALAA